MIQFMLLPFLLNGENEKEKITPAGTNCSLPKDWNFVDYVKYKWCRRGEKTSDAVQEVTQNIKEKYLFLKWLAAIIAILIIYDKVK